MEHVEFSGLILFLQDKSAVPSAQLQDLMASVSETDGHKVREMGVHRTQTDYIARGT